MGLITKIFGDPNKRVIKKLDSFVAQINQIEKKYQSLSEEQIKSKTQEFKQRYSKGESLDHLMPEAFAAVKNVCRRLAGTSWKVRGDNVKWNDIPFDVQIIGAILLHRGQVIEMKTGEGKTLVSTMPVYLNAITGKGVHVVTVNDYLVQRDSEWVGEIHRYLGLTVGTTLHGQMQEEKKQAYACDVTYGTNNEFGFDYLRDNMVMDFTAKVQRRIHYAIVDEVDSILVDEARTPLIISGPAQQRSELYDRFVTIIPRLEENVDYNIDEKARAVTLTEKGLDHIEKLLGGEKIYNQGGIALVHHLEAALKAKTLFKRDRDYVVKDNQVILVDEFTGRLMPGRRYSEGLHQAIEAKEGVKIQRESRTLATITFQNYFRLYKKLAGMTGTALTQAEEFSKVYHLETSDIPPNKPVIRKDFPDKIFKTEDGKFQAVAREIEKLYQKGQPVLIGTISIEKSERLSELLERKGVKHEVLNAKYHEKEAKIIEHAGEEGAVTIATNMAGRGTDIKLGNGVKELGGLHVLGTERHESRRIDNQLRGRSGRQGDPGSSQFYVSLEDDLMRIFGSDRVKSVMQTLGVPDDQPIEHRLISRSLENAQKKVEGNNFDVRKHLLEYDDVMNKQRSVVYKFRDEILQIWKKQQTERNAPEIQVTKDRADHNKTTDNALLSEERKFNTLKGRVLSIIEGEIENIVSLHTSSEHEEEWNLEEIAETIRTIIPTPQDLHTKLLEFEQKTRKKDGDVKARNDIISYLIELIQTVYQRRENELGLETMRQIERHVLLRTIDVLWVEHLDAMDSLREGIGLQGYGQRDPLIEYKKESYRMFRDFLDTVEKNVVYSIFKIGVTQQNRSPMENNSTMRTSSGDDSKNGSAGAQKKKDKVGRNDPCPCGSGKKYKKCHG